MTSEKAQDVGYGYKALARYLDGIDVPSEAERAERESPRGASLSIALSQTPRAAEPKTN